MPTLRPQVLSGLVVIPTVETQPGIVRVLLGINVGSSRGGPIDTVTREDLIVEAKNAAEGTLEAIQSPDPGPLPVRALRVVQARGVWTFGQGVNPPDEVVVTVRGDRKSFPMSDTFPQNAGLGKEPQEGDPFPGGKRLPFPFIDFFRRRRCCIKRFDAPLNRSPNPNAKSEKFDMEADVGSRPKGCSCGCCEYRQYVRGTFTNADGQAVRFDLPSGALDAAAYREDGHIFEYGVNKHGFYGHRATSSAGDAYGAQGCQYRGTETPGCPPTDTAHLEFVGLVVDRCRRRVAAKRTWVVDL